MFQEAKKTPENIFTQHLKESEMGKGFIFMSIFVFWLNIFCVDEDLPQSLCFGNTVAETLAGSITDMLGTQVNFVEKELMKRQPDKIWPTKHAADNASIQTQLDYFNTKGYATQNAGTVQNAWLHSSWNTRIIKYTLNRLYYFNLLSVCNSPWTNVEQAKRWAKWFTHAHEYYDAGIPNFNYVEAANEALREGELNKNLLGTEYDYSAYRLTEIVGDMTPDFPERIVWKMKNLNNENIVMLKYHDKSTATVDTWNDFNNNQVGRAIGENLCGGQNNCHNDIVESQPTCENIESLTSLNLCYRYESEDLDIRNIHTAKYDDGKTFITRFMSDIEDFRSAYNTDQDPLNAPLLHVCANAPLNELKDEVGNLILDDHGQKQYWADCDGDGIKDSEDPCSNLCDIKRTGHAGELVSVYIPEEGDNNIYEIFHPNGNNFYRYCEPVTFPVCDQYGNLAGIADNSSRGCDNGCEGCFSCEENGSTILCLVNGEEYSDYEFLCPTEGEYVCSGGSPEINSEIDSFIPGCSYPGCIPPWLNGFYDPVESEFSKVGGPVWDDMLTESRIRTMEHTYQIANSMNKTYSIVKDDTTSFGLYSYEHGTWTKIANVANYPEIGKSSTLVVDNTIFFAGGKDINGNPSNKLYGLNINSQSQSQYQIMFNSNSNGFVEIATLPDISNISMAVSNGSLYIMGNANQRFLIYKLETSGFVLLDRSQPARINYSIASDESGIYIAGGFTSLSASCGEKNYRDLIKFSTLTSSWTIIANNIKTDLTNVPMFKIGDKIYLANPRFRNGDFIRRIIIDVVTGEVLLDYKPSFKPDSYCLKETETALSGGIETSGECVPFTHPWYSSFSAGASVYSLDGKGDRLYVGTNNAIKVYDISDPISPVLVSSFSTSSRVNDLEVYGDALFAATNGGLYKLDASNDMLTQTLFVSAFLNSQYKVEVYNGKLYVGDSSGIKVRDLETLSVLTSVNNGSVLDFAIENGEIGLYKDALFYPVEIRDAETLTLKANEFFGCFEIEVGSSDGRFYLSCDDETYRFEDDGDGGVSFTELSGDIRELQDVYTYNGYTYFYDENTIWISTNNDVPALCGNGIVEGDEVCDGAPINCEDLDSNYVSGTATCNSTCDGYNTNNCSDDGW